jgi:hypothetical protein
MTRTVRKLQIANNVNDYKVLPDVLSATYAVACRGRPPLPGRGVRNAKRHPFAFIELQMISFTKIA